MLTKLFKHELLATWSMMIPVYAAMMITSGAGRLLNTVYSSSDNSLLQALMNFVRLMNGALLIITVLLTVYVIAQRVYKSMLGEKGKLTMSVPATVRQHLTARFASSMLLSVLTAVFCTAAYWLYRAKPPAVINDQLFDPEFGVVYNIMAAVLVLIVFAMVISGVFLSVALGHLFRGKRTLFSILFGVGVFALLCGAFFLALYFNPIEKAFFFIGGNVLQTLKDYGVFGDVFFALISAACFETANAVLKKRLNILD